MALSDHGPFPTHPLPLLHKGQVGRVLQAAAAIFNVEGEGWRPTTVVNPTAGINVCLRSQ